MCPLWVSYHIATSDLKGNSAYLGGYVKHDKGAFRGIAGIGIQYSDWDSHRNTMSDSYKKIILIED